MAISVGGLLTLLACLVIGPLVLGIYEFVKSKKQKASQQDDASKNAENDILQKENGREVVSKAEYTLGLLGYAIGIGNLWRFPFLCGRNGGAAFLVAYFTCLLLVSLPAYMIEMVMGQYTRKTTIGCFEAVHPIWRGLGWAQAFMLFFVLAYYNVLLGYSCIYIIGSVSTPFPWAPSSTGLGSASSAEYWNTGVLNRFPAEVATTGSQGLGPIQWELTIGLLAVWIIVFFAVGFGKKVLSKVTWVTVLMPIGLLLILLFRVAFLEAAGEGVAFYIGKFEISRLGDIKVWRDACVQILFSLSPGMGTAVTMASYTKPHENVHQTCWLVAICNSAFSFVGGFAIFSIVGNITYKINYQALPVMKAVVEAEILKFSAKFGALGVKFTSAASAATAEVAKFDLSKADLNNAGLDAAAAVFLRNAISKMNGALDTTALQQQHIQAGMNFTKSLEGLELQAIKETARAGPGLAFIAIADGMQTFGDAQNIIAVLFFLTLLTLGLDSTFAWAETWVCYVDDTIRLLKPDAKVPKAYSVAFVSVVLFLIGLPFCTRMGNELLDTVDNYVGLMFLLFGVFIESILFCLHFGFNRFVDALDTACGVKLGPIQKVYWRVTTHFTMPAIPIGVFIWNFVQAYQEPYEGYPGWMQIIGWTLMSICILLIPIGAATGLRLGGSQLDNMPGKKISDDAKGVAKADDVKPAATEEASQPDLIALGLKTGEEKGTEEGVKVAVASV